MTTVWLLLWSCEGQLDGVDDGRDIVETADLFTVAPAYEPNTAGAGLVGYVTLETDRPTTVRIDIDDGGRTWEHTAEEPATTHRIRILGLKPATTHDLQVTATANDGTTATAELSAATDPLPADFPAFTVTSDPDRMEPGVTFATFSPYVAMVDPEGTIRWYLDPDIANSFVLTERGTLLGLTNRTGLVELELDGAEIATWRAARTTSRVAGTIPVDAEAFHHDLLELPNGNILALSIERRSVPDFPTSEANPNAPRAEAWVAGDVVVELQRDGSLVHEFRLLDLLDPQRIGYNVMSSDFWRGFYTEDTLDWSHANAIWYDEIRDEIVVSLRHQDAVVALDHATGDVQWIFSPRANWRAPWDELLLAPEVPAMPAYHQHGAKITPSGTLMLFDNGNYRASAYEPKVSDKTNASRGAEFVLDHTVGTWTLAFQFGEALDPKLFAAAHGDCDPLPQTSNVLVTYGSVYDRTQPAVQVFEVARANPPEVVFHMTLDHPKISPRAERITGILPGF
jgi:arylsulfate sulfotransferase